MIRGGGKGMLLTIGGLHEPHAGGAVRLIFFMKHNAANPKLLSFASAVCNDSLTCPQEREAFVRQKVQAHTLQGIALSQMALTAHWGRTARALCQEGRGHDYQRHST
mmetsp:Transcript_148817/g.258474  ORF Transcript_148817/g.258474 Transcript_148817/m.258474 type:complete len:107 (+) Transcript_148817:3-323(+)